MSPCTGLKNIRRSQLVGCCLRVRKSRIHSLISTTWDFCGVCTTWHCVAGGCRTIPWSCTLHDTGVQQVYALHDGTKHSTTAEHLKAFQCKHGGRVLHHALHALNCSVDLLYHVGIMSGNQTRPRCFDTSQWISSREYLWSGISTSSMMESWDSLRPHVFTNSTKALQETSHSPRPMADSWVQCFAMRISSSSRGRRPLAHTTSSTRRGQWRPTRPKTSLLTERPK